MTAELFGQYYSWWNWSERHDYRIVAHRHTQTHTHNNNNNNKTVKFIAHKNGRFVLPSPDVLLWHLFGGVLVLLFSWTPGRFRFIFSPWCDLHSCRDCENQQSFRSHFSLSTGNHSCVPNAEINFYHGDHTLTLTALRDIQPGEVRSVWLPSP